MNKSSSQSSWRSRRNLFSQDAAWLLLLAACVTLFHWRGIQPGFTFLPVDLAGNNLPWRGAEPAALQNSLISDPLYQFYPFLNQALTAVRDDHQWPLWNAQIMLGHPTVGDPLAQPFFPPLLLLGLFFGAARGFALGLWLLALLGAFLTYGWLRVSRASPLAAFAGGLTYALGGYMVTWFETPFWLSTLALLPGVLFAYELALQKRNGRYTALAALLLGLAVLGGQLQFMIIFVLFFALYALGRVVESRLETGRFSYTPLANYALVLILGVLLGSVLLLPAIELLGLSRRAAGSGALDALPWPQLVTLLTPEIFGTTTPIHTVWSSGNFSENTIYAGVVMLLLAGVAPFAERRFFTVYLAVITAAILYFIIGGPGVAALGRLPGLNYASLHRTSFILPLLIAYLGSRTLSAPAISVKASLLIGVVFAVVLFLAYFFVIATARVPRPFPPPGMVKVVLLLALTLLLIALAAYRPRYHKPALLGLAALVFVDLFTFGARFNPAGAIEQLMPPTAVIEYLQQSEHQRVAALQRNNQVLFGPNILSLFDLAEIGGYSSLTIDRYHQLVSAADPVLDVWWMERQGNMVTFSFPTMRLLDLFQVSHLVSPEPVDMTAVRVEFAHDGCASSSETLSNENPLNGRFTVQNTAINRLDLRFRIDEADQARKAMPLIRLWAGAQDGRLVLESEQELVAADEEELAVAFFAAERYAPGQEYVWEVSTGAEQSGISLCVDEAGEPALSVYGSEWREDSVDDLFIYERLAPMPRAYVVYAAEQIADDAGAVARLLDEDFPLRRTAVTADALPLPESSDRPFTPAQITEYGDTRVTVHANSAADGLLILGDQYHPGWHVTVDGSPAELLRVNHIMRGVLLPPGEHDVAFDFLPDSLRLGILLAAIGLALMACLARFK